MNRPDKFEQEWRNAMDGAETQPSARLWKNIEHDLAAKSNSSLKKRVFYYKYAAAVALLLAIGIGTYSVLQLSETGILPPEIQAEEQNTTPVQSDKQEDLKSFSDANKVQENHNQDKGSMDSENQKNDEQLALNESQTVRPDTRESNTLTIEENTFNGSNEKEINPNEHRADSKHNTISDNRIDSKAGETGGVTNSTAKNLIGKVSERNASFQTLAGINEANDSNGQLISDATNKAGVVAASRMDGLDYVSALGLDRQLGGLLEREPKMVPWYTYIPDQKEHKVSDDMWFGIAMAAGRNDPNFGSGTDALASTAESFNSASTADGIQNLGSISEERAGQVVQVGLDVGKRISKNWILFSGLNYIQRTTSQQSNITTTSSSGRNFALNASSSLDQSNQIYITAPYQLVNEYNSLAIPLQAGYVLVDRKFNVMLTGGFSNEFLLYNNIESSSSVVESQRVNGGDGNLSTYILSGQLGTELSYIFADNYMISLSPQVRQAITSMLNDNNNEGYRPRLFTVGMHFRYLLK